MFSRKEYIVGPNIGFPLFSEENTNFYRKSEKIGNRSITTLYTDFILKSDRMPNLKFNASLIPLGKISKVEALTLEDPDSPDYETGYLVNGEDSYWQQRSSKIWSILRHDNLRWINEAYPLFLNIKIELNRRGENYEALKNLKFSLDFPDRPRLVAKQDVNFNTGIGRFNYYYFEDKGPLAMPKGNRCEIRSIPIRDSLLLGFKEGGDLNEAGIARVTFTDDVPDVYKSFLATLKF